MHLPLEELVKFIENYKFNDQRDNIFRQIKNKFARSLKLCIELGIGYLTMSRKANTLSGGEAQRLKIVAQISSEISGVVYVLDEPSSGLHACDIEKVLKAIKNLNSIGNKNTIVLVEHTKKIINASDYIFEVGPKAGEYGGRIIAEGSLESIINNPQSISGKYLSNN
ncbi:MAG: excinuclease ABC subunit UvrA, partial [Bacilli bacterium]|nr:excinuclease ABC subunit UvrA [Bacilli bacterium]